MVGGLGVMVATDTCCTQRDRSQIPHTSRIQRAAVGDHAAVDHSSIAQTCTGALYRTCCSTQVQMLHELQSPQETVRQIPHTVHRTSAGLQRIRKGCRRVLSDTGHHTCCTADTERITVRRYADAVHMACIVHGRRQNSLLLSCIQGYSHALHEGIQGSVHVSCVACLDAAKLGVPQRAADFCRLCNRHIRKPCLHRPAACSAQRQVGT